MAREHWRDLVVGAVSSVALLRCCFDGAHAGPLDGRRHGWTGTAFLADSQTCTGSRDARAAQKEACRVKTTRPQTCFAIRTSSNFGALPRQVTRAERESDETFRTCRSAAASSRCQTVEVKIEFPLDVDSAIIVVGSGSRMRKSPALYRDGQAGAQSVCGTAHERGVLAWSGPCLSLFARPSQTRHAAVAADAPCGDVSQLLLDHTLKQVGTRYPLIVLTTASFPEKHLALLTALGIEYRKVDLLEPKGEVKLIAERFKDTWSKLQAFALDDYEVRRGPLSLRPR